MFMVKMVVASSLTRRIIVASSPPPLQLRWHRHKYRAIVALYIVLEDKGGLDHQPPLPPPEQFISYARQPQALQRLAWPRLQVMPHRLCSHPVPPPLAHDLITPSSFVASSSLFYHALESHLPKPSFNPSNVYSFDILLLELLTEKTPFQDLVRENNANIPRWVRSVSGMTPMRTSGYSRMRHVAIEV